MAIGQLGPRKPGAGYAVHGRRCSPWAWASGQPVMQTMLRSPLWALHRYNKDAATTRQPGLVLVAPWCCCRRPGAVLFLKSTHPCGQWAKRTVVVTPPQLQRL